MHKWIGWVVAAWIVAMTVGGPAWAQSSTGDESKPADTAAETEKPAAADEVTDTADNRANKTLYIGFVPGGVHIPSLATHPVQLGVYLGDFLIGGEFGKFSYTYEDSGDKADGDYTNVGAFARWFPGNSFNFLFAVNKRTWDVDATVSDSYGTVHGRLKADATVYTLGVGNQWITDFGLVFGMDWLVASGIGSSSSTFTSPDLAGVPAGPQRDAATKDLEDLGDLLNKVSGLPGLFIVSVGFAF